MQDDEREQLERISALADGQLVGDEFAHAMDWVGSSEQARASWHAYHVIGDALRSVELTDCSRDRAFAARVCERLAQVDPVGLQADAVSPPGQPTPAWCAASSTSTSVTARARRCSAWPPR